MTKDGFAQLVMRLYGYWSDQPPLPEAVLPLWFDKLAPFPNGHALAAVEAFFNDGATFRPKLPEVVAKIRALTDDTPDWGNAWTEIKSNAVAECNAGDYPRTEYGGCDPPIWSHPLIREVAHEIGFRQLANLELGDTTAEAQAREKYRALRQRADETRRYAAIPGIESGRLAMPEPDGIAPAAETRRGGVPTALGHLDATTLAAAIGTVERVKR